MRMVGPSIFQQSFTWYCRHILCSRASGIAGVLTTFNCSCFSTYFFSNQQKLYYNSGEFNKASQCLKAFDKMVWQHLMGRQASPHIQADRAGSINTQRYSTPSTKKKSYTQCHIPFDFHCSNVVYQFCPQSSLNRVCRTQYGITKMTANNPIDLSFF